MNEWNEGISKWRADRINNTFKKKYGRSLGSSRQFSHFSKGHKIPGRHSRSKNQRLHRVSPKNQKEWAKGVSQWVAQREVVRSNHYFLKKFGIIKGNSSEEWKEGMQKWLDQNLLNKSWKWRGSKSKSNPSKNRRRIKRLNQQLQLYKKEKLRDDFPSSKIDKENKSHALQTNEEIPSQEFQVYLFKNEKQFGPYSLEEIEEFLACDHLKLDDLAFFKGCENWIKVKEIPGLNFNENIEIQNSLAIGSEQSKEVLEIENLEKDKEENFKKEDESSKDLDLLEKQMKPGKSKLFTFGIYSLVGIIVSLVYGLGYYHGAAVDKTVIIKNLTGTEKTSPQNMARLPDKKSEFSQSDEVKKVSLSNQGFEKNSNSPFGNSFSVKEARGLEMLWVKPGKFTMGKMGDLSTRGFGSQQKVSITNGFYLGKYEVTQSQYKAVMQGNDYGLESNPSRSKGEKEPVTRVSWDDIQIFLKILNSKEGNAGRLPLQWNYSLPTEAEWEYACRAGTTTKYSWGDDMNASMANCDGKVGRHIRVGQYPPNAWGFYDMHGNVGERVFDWYAHYSEQNEVDPIGPPSGDSKINRGGYYMSSAENLSSYGKKVSDTKHFNSGGGFRLALRSWSLAGDTNSNQDPQVVVNDSFTEEGEVVGAPEGTEKESSVITLTGGTSILWPVGKRWVEPGYKAIDGGEDLSSFVETVSFVDVSTPGQYKVIYTVKYPKSGEVSDSVERFVTVNASGFIAGANVSYNDRLDGVVLGDEKITAVIGDNDDDIVYVDNDDRHLRLAGTDSKISNLIEKSENKQLSIQQKQEHNIELNPSVRLEMLWVNPGTFTMGSPTSETRRQTDETQHQVTLTNGFYLGKYEVTQAQYQTVMNGNSAGLNADPSQFKGSNRPVEKASWEDAQIFLSRLNSIEQSAGRLPNGWKYVLPTEAEWEYACRAGTTTAYSWGNDINSSRANYNWDEGGSSGNDFKQTRDVGQYAANPWGFFDMHGNVREWVHDWKANYLSGAQTDPTGPASGSSRVIRGGSWNKDGTSLRSARRSTNTPSSRSNSLGFRVGFQKQ